ncbi:MAG TPA: hybrid sensor histidine kinase/response regulator [Prolixibacteraceae bacterium]|nr:hybrid sensor histidine kinase/response regulator [Prolixibacteraceae bacterium]
MKKFNILVINDNVMDMVSLQEILVANDFVVKTAASGNAGLKILTEGSTDLVFIGVDMAGKSDYQTCKTIKLNTDLKGTPVIFIVGNDDLIFVKEIFESGGDDYITKPFVWSELLMKARIHLELKYSREMSRNMNHILEAKVAQRTVELEDSITKLGEAKKELELLNIAKSEFLNLISHEIRTPLNGIMGSLALIGRYQYTDEVNRYFSLLDTSVKRLEKFSNTILEASTLRLKGEKALNKLDVDLVKVIQVAIDENSKKFLEKNIDLVIQNDTTNSSLNGDPKLLLKSFSAVLDNSFKFTPKEGKVEIKISNDANGFIKVSIADSGKGFSKIAMDNIYKPLSNLEAHFDQNTGMGLHLAKLIVDAHAGFISAGNRIPKGALIEILLPTKH